MGPDHREPISEREHDRRVDPCEGPRNDEVPGDDIARRSVGAVEPMDAEKVGRIGVIRPDRRQPRRDAGRRDRGIGELCEGRQRDAGGAEALYGTVARLGVDDVGLETETGTGHSLAAALSSTSKVASGRTRLAGMLGSCATSFCTISALSAPAARNITSRARFTVGTVKVIRTRPR